MSTRRPTKTDEDSSARGRPRAETVLVTGASGLIGSHAARCFREAGWTVRALARPDSDVRYLEELGTEIVLGDVTAPGSLTGAAEGCRAVLHAAAVLGRAAPWDTFREVNVEGTRNVLTEAVRAGCERFVLVSSIAVYGDLAYHGGTVTERSPTDSELDHHQHYERSKRMAETAVRRAGPEALGRTVLRPAVVTGERDRHFAPRVARIAGRALVPMVGTGQNPLPLVYAGNVAEACRLAVVSDEAVGRTYNVSEDGGITQRELLEAAAGPSTRLLPLPRRAVEAAAALVDGVASLGGDESRVWSARRVRLLGRPNPYSSERIRRELGWRPPVTTREGWNRTLTWLRDSGRAGS